VQWGALRALNDDLVQPGKGFAPHPHQDIETVTYPLHGRIEHRDNLGNRHVYGRGQVQRMSAGSGIVHSEMNVSASEPERHLQIWFFPAAAGGAPECELRAISDEEKRNCWRKIASSDGSDGSLRVRQNVAMYACLLDSGHALAYRFGATRLGYLHIVSGQLRLPDGSELTEGDGMCMPAGASLALHALAPSEALLFDL
jgi:redox-sensitive bicupin YhaK (pirin superfamily)